MSKEKNLSFVIQRITTEQFAVIRDSFEKDKSISITNGLNVGVDKESRTVAVAFKVTFESEKRPFIILEIVCKFEVEATSFKLITDEKTNQVHLPEGFIKHLAVITVGTARGILHAKLENTDFKDYFLPSVNVNELIKEDIII